LAFVFIAPGSHSAGNISISWHIHVIPCVQKTEFWISAKLNRGYLCRKASQGIRQAFILGSAIRVGNSKPNYTKSLRLRRNSVSISDLMDARRIYPMAHGEANPIDDRLVRVYNFERSQFAMTLNFQVQDRTTMGRL